MGKSNIIGKVVMEGILEVCSPLLIGAGQDDDLAGNDKDIHVLRVSDGEGNIRCTIPGTSLAGVLRDLMAEQSGEMTVGLFGELDRMQSSVEIRDVVLENAVPIYRDGVKIDEDLGSAEDGAKYDYEAVERGAHGALRLVVNLRGVHTDNPGNWKEASISSDVINAVSYIRDCLSDGISLGAMTAKGLGQVRVKNLKAGLYDFARKQDVIAWLSQEEPTAQKAGEMLDKKSSWEADSQRLRIEADFALCSSLIVRDYGAEVKNKDGKRVITSLKSGKDFVIPGTSIKGVLRHQAAYILESLGGKKEYLDTLMGTADAGNKKQETEGRIKSRFYVKEAYISLGNKAPICEAEVTRNRIDRFTGGTIESALFAERPLWQADSNIPTVHLDMYIKMPDDVDVGLALFLLKDLWQGKIPLGGESGVGRGILKGIHARIHYHDSEYEMDNEGKIVSGKKEELEQAAAAFVSFAKEA